MCLCINRRQRMSAAREAAHLGGGPPPFCLPGAHPALQALRFVLRRMLALRPDLLQCKYAEQRLSAKQQDV